MIWSYLIRLHTVYSFRRGVVQVMNARRTISIFSETEKHIGLTLLCFDKKFSGTTSLTLNFLRDFYNLPIS